MIQISAINSFYKYDKIFVSHLYGEPKRSQCKHQYRSDVNIFSTTKKYLVHALKLVSHEYDAWHTLHLRKYKRERKAENNDNDYLMPGISFFQPTYNAAWMLLHKSFRRFFPVKGHKNNTIYSSQHPHVEATLCWWVWEPWKAQDDIPSTLPKGPIFHLMVVMVRQWSYWFSKKEKPTSPDREK